MTSDREGGPRTGTTSLWDYFQQGRAANTDPLALLDGVYAQLKHLPARARPGDANVSLELPEWLSYVDDPSPDVLGDHASLVRERRREIEHDEFVNLEFARIRAILSLAELSPAKQRAGESALDRHANRFEVHRWIRDVMRRGESSTDVYFPSYRQHDSQTYPPEAPEDPYTIEVLAFLCDGPALRPIFTHYPDELLPTVIRWLIRRYELGAALKLFRAYCTAKKRLRERGTRTSERASLLIQFTLPRMWTAAGIGGFAAASQTDVRQVLWHLARWNGLGWSYLAACAATAIFFLTIEIDRRAPLRRSKTRAVLVVFFISLLGASVSCVPVGLLADLGARLTPCTPDPRQVDVALLLRVWPLLAATSLVLGYALQLVWDDKPASDRL